VKKVYPDIEQAWLDSFWSYLTQARLDFLRLRVGPLLRYAVCDDVAGVTFTNKAERLKLQIMLGKETGGSVASIREDVSRLPAFVFEKGERQVTAEFCLAESILAAKPAELDRVIDQLADQMKYRRERPDSFLQIDLKDAIALNGYILLKGGTEKVYVTDYREMVEQRVLALIGSHPVIEAISRGDDVSDEALIALERTLRHELGGSDVELAEENIRKAFGFKVGSLIEFLRRQLDLGGIPDYESIVGRQFERYITAHTFNANQVLFLRTLRSAFLQKRRLALPDLYEPPLTNFGVDAVERWFSQEQVAEVLKFVDTISVID